MGGHSHTRLIRLGMNPSVSDHSHILPEPHSRQDLTGISSVSCRNSSQSTSRRLEPTRTASIQFEMSPLGIHPEKFQIGWTGLSPRKALQTVWFSVKAVYGCGVQTITEVHIQLNSFVWESYQTAKSARFFPLFSASTNHRGARTQQDHLHPQSLKN